MKLQLQSSERSPLFYFIYLFQGYKATVVRHLHPSRSNARSPFEDPKYSLLGTVVLRTGTKKAVCGLSPPDSALTQVFLEFRSLRVPSENLSKDPS